VGLGTARHAGVQLPHGAQPLKRQLAHAQIVVDAPERATLDVQHLERHEHAVEKAGPFRLEVLLVPVERDLVHLSAIDLVLARGQARRGDHGVPRGRIEPEVVPHVTDRQSPLVRPSLGKHANRRITGAVEREHTHHVVRTRIDLRPGEENRLESRSARLLHVKARNPVTHAARHEWRVPELPVPGNGGADHQIIERVGRNPPQTQYPVHCLARELPDVDLGQGGRLPRGEVAAAPRAVGDSGIAEHRRSLRHDDVGGWGESALTERQNPVRVTMGCPSS
jgi:hypothetical protein